MDPPLCSKKQTPEYGKEASSIAHQKEVQNSTISRKSDVDNYLGCTGSSFLTLIREGHNSKHCALY
jgi:hypothetical protein